MLKKIRASEKKTPVAFITGGASGIGLATAEKLARHGYSIALVDINKEEVENAAQQLGQPHIGIQADVSSETSLRLAADECVKTLGGIDVAVANAGVGSASTVRASETSQLTRIIDINLSGQIRTVKGTLEEIIRNQGYVVFTCSAAVLKNTPKSSAYAAAKAGVEAFAGALRQEVAHRGVGVGVFYPGWTKTPMIQGSNSRSGQSNTLPWPLNKMNTLDEVAEAYSECIIKRKRSKYVPRIHRIVHWFRPYFTGACWDRKLQKSTQQNVNMWEEEFLKNRNLRVE